MELLIVYMTSLVNMAFANEVSTLSGAKMEQLCMQFSLKIGQTCWEEFALPKKLF